MSAKRRPGRVILLILCMLIAAGVVALSMGAGVAELDTSAAKTYILKNHKADTAADNAVAAVYLNYRFWDTLFESLMLIASVLAVINLSWSGNAKDGEDT